MADMNARFQIDGLDALQRQMETLGPRVAKRVVRTACRAAMKPLHAEVKRRIAALPSSGRAGPLGSLKKRMLRALKLRVAKHQPRGQYAMDVIFVDPESAGLVHYPKGAATSLTTRKTTGTRTFIPAALEFGHGSDRQGSARPFFRPAVDTMRPEVQRVLEKELHNGILREAIRGRYA